MARATRTLNRQPPAPLVSRREVAFEIVEANLGIQIEEPVVEEVTMADPHPALVLTPPAMAPVPEQMIVPQVMGKLLHQAVKGW